LENIGVNEFENRIQHPKDAVLHLKDYNIQ